MTDAGSIRRWANRPARRRISWTEQRTIGGAVRWARFWGWQGGGRPVADHRQQGEGEHHQRNVTVPAVPAAGLVVLEPELGLGGLERVLDRPAPALDTDQHLERGPARAPGGEVS